VTAIPLPDRPALVRRSQWLNYATMAYNSLEAIVAIGAGALAGCVALIGFGVDSVIELTAGVTALWRLRADHSAERRARAELSSLRVIGLCFIALAIYVGVDAARSLIARSAPDASRVGIILAIASLGIMPWLATAKRRIAFQLRSGALAAEARQTMICTYLSAILLGGLALNALLGWWWADPVAGLAMVPLITWEGIEGLRGRSPCGDDCHTGGVSVA
jgi:divalent metal cation (Fe/Co/Zn/Cd) transporter